MTVVSGTELPSLEGVLARASSENFPVALRVLPRDIRSDLLAIYAFARLVDDIGDELPGGPPARLAALDAVRSELASASSGTPASSTGVHPIFSGLAGVIERRRLDTGLFVDLIEANRQDQWVTSYDTYEQLLGYCRLSANPVGRAVLGIFDVRDPESDRLSDLICTGLQLVEHWQDVAEDAAAGRCYLPAEDRVRYGVTLQDLVAGRPASDAFRRLIAVETGRARTLLDQGSALLERVGGGARFAIGGYCGGGLAQVAAIERRGYDVLSGPAKASKVAMALSTMRALRRRDHRWR